jgi:CHAT domain-containing protein/tetratricopeptide (TPR) repeat protein
LREANEHLTVPEVLRLLVGRAHSADEAYTLELERHVEQCEHCRQMKEEYRLFMSKLFQFGQTVDRTPPGPCPPAEIWGELAAGILPEKTAFKHLQHACACTDCGEELQNALYAMDESAPLPTGIQQPLVTASEAWQSSFATRLESQGRSAPSGVPLGRRSTFSRFVARPWAISAIAAVILLAVGLGIFSSLRRNSPDTLIRQAYAQQRTLEMRIPGAAYGPIQVERGNERSSMSSPRPLLEAEVMIKSGLEKAPDDPELLRQKAEADLLAWNYQPAIETLNHAARIRPDFFPLLVDLATAYFERAEATSSPADYEAGLESLGKAIRLEPANPAALFNRAILYERLYFYDRAIADWEQLLKIEQDPQWKDEAARRLKEIRSRQRERGDRTVPDKLSLAGFQQELETGHTVIEEYVEAAERNLLPEIAAPDSSDQRYRASAALAEKLRTEHSDPFFQDLLAAAGQPDFHQAALFLGESSRANHGGHFEHAYDQASRATALFRKSGNSAGWLAALFEQSYALQFESQAGGCRTLAASAAADARKLNYAFLEVQLLLEHAICSNMSGAVGPAKETVQRALAVAKDHGYQSLYLRGLTLLANLESDAGDDAQAWSAVQEGLALYWKSGLPPVRAYSFYAALDRMAERLGHANVQFAALSEALKFRAENSNHVVEAAAHARLGDAALRLGDLALAEDQFAHAERLFAAEPPADSVRWRQLEAHINLARVQALRGADTKQVAASLAGSLPEVQRLSNQYVEFLYYDTLASLKMRAGDTDAARGLLEHAIEIAETGAESLSTWREKLAWMELHRAPFAGMAALLLDSGSPAQALEQWQRYRTAGAPGPALSLAHSGIKKPEGNLLQRVSVSPAPPLHSYVLTYAFVPSGLIIWVRHGQEVHAVQVAVPVRTVQHTAESFISECARPGSDLSDLQADAHTLYQWLLGPVRQWLPPDGHLVVEPDGILSALPLEALMDENSGYLGARYTISIALNVRAKDAPEKKFALAAGERALIVAAPAAPDGPPAPPPGALAEAMHVAAHFSHPALLVGREANTSQVAKELERSAIFHFAGHAGFDRNGAALFLADGSLRREGPAGNHRLDHLRLAVFSACATARLSETSAARSLVGDFLQAGARNVAASRWNVDSVATEDFMGLFYDSLLAGHTPAEALQAAGNSFRQVHGRAHPYYWAAFTAFGSV